MLQYYSFLSHLELFFIFARVEVVVISFHHQI